MDWVPGGPGDRSPAGFRARHGSHHGPMSLTLYRKLQKAGCGPRETIVGGVVIILPEDERAWEDERRNPTNESELESIAATRARWHRRALAAGAASKKSPKHISKQRKGRAKRSK
jgi:hypothetical protein